MANFFVDLPMKNGESPYLELCKRCFIVYQRVDFERYHGQSHEIFRNRRLRSRHAMASRRNAGMCMGTPDFFEGAVKGVPPKKTWIMLGYVVHLNVKDLVDVFIFNMNESQ